MRAEGRFVRIALRVFFLAALAAALAMAVWYVWRPSHLVWARNAYAMTQAGAWEGWEGFSALLVYWFFELRGRTVVALLSMLTWFLSAWSVLGREPKGRMYG